MIFFKSFLLTFLYFSFFLYGFFSYLFPLSSFFSFCFNFLYHFYFIFSFFCFFPLFCFLFFLYFVFLYSFFLFFVFSRQYKMAWIGTTGHTFFLNARNFLLMLLQPNGVYFWRLCFCEVSGPKIWCLDQKIILTLQGLQSKLG